MSGHRLARAARAALLGLCAIPLGAWIELPLYPVPMSLQTLAVLTLGALLGRARGALAVATYLLAGAAGLPLFAGGAAGVQHLSGPTAGYLFGFLASTWISGGARLPPHSAADCLRLVARLAWAHLSILALGTAWLARSQGVAAALETGLHPFWLAALAKSVLAAALVALLAARPERARERRERESGPATRA